MNNTKTQTEADSMFLEQLEELCGNHATFGLLGHDRCECSGCVRIRALKANMTQTQTTKAGEWTQHTPGPWKHLDFAVISEEINDYGNFVIAEVRRQLTKEDQANLRLVAAAPELLAACKYALHCEECLGLACSPDSIKLYRAAIAKAEGK